MTTTLKIEFKLEGSVADVLDNPSLTDWIAQAYLVCKLQGIGFAAFINGDPLDITILRGPFTSSEEMPS